MRIYRPEELGLAPITIRSIMEGWTDDGNGNIRCFNGRLNPRPCYQREFVYNDKDQREIFKTLDRSFPLGTFYWCEVDGNFELIDGQQRILSIHNIIMGNVYIEKHGEKKYWDELAEASRDAILDQELSIYICRGDQSELMDWFRTINIVGKLLTTQEIRSAVYSGPFVNSAKRWFVKGTAGCPAVGVDFEDFIKGATERQAILETALKWHADFENYHSDADHDAINDYLRTHKNDADATALWDYYTRVIRWADGLFTDTNPTHNFISEQQKVDWGLLYNKYHELEINADDIKSKVAGLMANPEVERKSGIYEYVFDGEVKHLNPRAFKDSDKKSAFAACGGNCAYCGNHIPRVESAHADHIVPWSRGGRTEYANLQILCVRCNEAKSNREEAEARTVFAIPATT